MRNQVRTIRNAAFALPACLLYLTGAPAQAAPDLRTFTSAEGETIEARITKLDGDDRVHLVRADGRRFTVSLERFSKKDREFLRSWAEDNKDADRPSGPDHAAINGTIGHPLFADAHLWDDPVADVARRLGWPRESQTETLSSFRMYPDNSYRFLGARPYSAALYGEDGNPASVSLVFANKGDFSPPPDAGGRGSRRGLAGAIRADEAKLSEALTAILGPHERQSYGEGSHYRRVSRWDWGDHAFILSEAEEEYVSLSIVPSRRANAKGRAATPRTAELKDKAAGNVAENNRGDVYIRNIPMVDQGPKGYCVPATFERYMRYMRIPADMYLLAMSGETRAGGGTLMNRFIEGVKSDISRHNRTLREAGLRRMDLHNIAHYIDQGIPILWQLDSTEAFNTLANRQTNARRTIRDPREWERKVEEFRSLAERVQPNRARGHIAMIIGYNRETREIAVSDSWGPAYEKRWITLEAAEPVSRDFHVIYF